MNKKVRIAKHETNNNTIVNSINGNVQVINDSKADSTFKQFDYSSIECESIITKSFHFESKLNNLEKNSLIEYIFSNSIHAAITVSIIKSLAYKPISMNSEGVKLYSKNMNSCLQLIKSGYTETIIDDLKSGVMLALIELINADHLQMIDNKLVFETYTAKTGKEKSFYTALYRAVENTFTEFSNKNAESLEGIINNADGTKTDSNGEIKRSNLDVLNASYVGASFDNDVVFNHDISMFWNYFKSHYPKKYHNCYSVFCGMLEGMTQQQIAEKMECHIDTIKRAKKDFVNVWNNEYRGNITLKHDNNPTYITTYKEDERINLLSWLTGEIKDYGDNDIIIPVKPFKADISPKKRAALEKIEQDKQAAIKARKTAIKAYKEDTDYIETALNNNTRLLPTTVRENRKNGILQSIDLMQGTKCLHTIKAR